MVTILLELNGHANIVELVDVVKDRRDHDLWLLFRASYSSCFNL